MNYLVPLAWDSEFLSFGVACLSARALSRADLAPLVTQARAAGTRLLYVVATPADVLSSASALHSGAWLADRKVIFAQSVEREAATLAIPCAGKPGPAKRRIFPVSARPKLCAGCIFAPVPALAAPFAGGELARNVLAATGGPDPAAATCCGLLTLAGAVAQPARRQYIGQALVVAARQRTAAWGLGELQVATQLDNAPACAFYRRCGFWQARVVHNSPFLAVRQPAPAPYFFGYSLHDFYRSHSFQ